MAAGPETPILTELTDQELLLTGGPDAFAELFGRHEPVIRAAASRMIASDRRYLDGDDVAQTIALRTLARINSNNPPDFSGKDGARPYFWEAARNMLRDVWKSSAYTTRYDEDPDVMANAHPAMHSNPADLIPARLLIQKILATLTTEEQSMFTMKANGTSDQDCAACMGRPGAFKARLHRLRVRVKRAFPQEAADLFDTEEPA